MIIPLDAEFGVYRAKKGAAAKVINRVQRTISATESLSVRLDARMFGW